MPVAKYDVETFLDALGTLLTSNLNTKIAEISTEKGDASTVPMAQLHADAFFKQTLNNDCAAFDPYLLYGVTDISTDGIGPASIRTCTFEVSIVVADQGTDKNIVKRVLRYQRALEEVLHENFDRLRAGFKLKVNSLVPVQLTAVNSPAQFRAVGVELQLVIA